MRRILAGLTLGLAVCAVGPPATAQTDGERPELMERALTLFGPDIEVGREALRWFEARDDPNDMPALIQIYRYSRGVWHEIDETMAVIAGEDVGDGWRDWMLWQEAQTDLEPTYGFVHLKAEVYARIDPNFRLFLHPGVAHEIRLEEIVWGGVTKDGIPALDNPKQITAGEADYLSDNALVFGVEINGDARAYPLRIMDWHEMFNDVIGGVPVSLAYCTLCASGILFEGAVDGYEEPFTFGSSGLLYRSNKLMYDRATHSLWNQFTGRPVVGPLTGTGIVLKTRPVAITSWANWRARHPDTTVLSLETGFSRDYSPGAAYGDYFASSELMFPALVGDASLEAKDYVFALRGAPAKKAWDLRLFEGGAVVNDSVGAMDVTLVGDAETRTVRAYRTEGETFERLAEGGDRRVTADGAVWRVEEDALIGPDGARRERLPGHVAYWFAWSGYFGADGSVVQR